MKPTGSGPVDDQQRRGAFDQRARMLVTVPAQRIQPAGQAKPGRSVVGEFGEAVALTDKGEMAKVLAAMVESSP